MAKKAKSKKQQGPELHDLIELIEERIPPSSAETWDAVGLVVGNPHAEFTGAVIGVDLTENLMDLAVKKKANLVVIHHPPLFPKGRGLNQLVHTHQKNMSDLLMKAHSQGLNVYVAHTNFDKCAIDGMVTLAEELGAEIEGRIIPDLKDNDHYFYKLVTYIPEKNFDDVRNALYEVGCGHIGNYDSCGFAMKGLGSFRGLQGSSPSVGESGKLEELEEIRFETLVVKGMEDLVIRVLKNVHPYEEVAYDLIRVEQKPAKVGLVWGLGYGFIATLKKPMSMSAFIAKTKKVFHTASFLMPSDHGKTVKRIAFSPGSGSSFVRSVSRAKCDVYITGEVGYHSSLEASKKGLTVFELGHRESEHFFLRTWHSWFREWELPHHVLDERTQKIV